MPQKVPALEVALYFEDSNKHRSSVSSDAVLVHSEQGLALTLLALADKCRVGSPILLVVFVAEKLS
jgi:hypothetical protein